MDFNDTPDDAAYRAKARAWLDANAPEFSGPHGELQPGSESLRVARAWHVRKAEAGYVAITWPKEWGGQGGSPIQQVIFAQEEHRFDLPDNAFHVSLGTCVPTVMAFADAATRARFGPPAVRGEEIWCQLFSEPSGGSDLAGVRTRAERAADGSGDWIINGQKVWTTYARFSDFGLIVCRTDPDAPKHKGITLFRIDMRDPGVTVRPIHQMSGASTFNEVFFNDVRVGDDHRVGEVNDGWRVSVATLMNERFAIAPAREPGWREFLDLARSTAGRAAGGDALDQALREKIADWYVATTALTNTRNRTMTALSRGQTPGAESTIVKLVLGQHLQDIGSNAIDMLDQYGILHDEELNPLQADFQQIWLSSAGLRIAGGPDEILKNILAERILGLPGDVRVDKDVPFKDIPRGV
jgi:alkylation response protein AidB-like acyl-CoA dehydrogenase